MGLLNYTNFIVNEATQSAQSFNVPSIVQQAAAAAKKTAEFDFFLANLPTTAIKDGNTILDIINKDAKKRTDFFDKLATLSISDLEKGLDPTEYSRGGSIASVIFDLEPNGMGRGEIFLAWIIKDAISQGGGIDFDLQVGKSIYEVKDYRKDNSPIRLGVQAAVNRFAFWKQILKTISLIQNLQTEVAPGTKKFDIAAHFDDKEFVATLEYIISRELDIPTGKFARKDYENFKKFYELISKVEYKSDEYTSVELRGPGVKPVEVSIKPIAPVDVESGKYNLEVVSGQEKDYILTNLRRLDYARNPAQFDEDLQKSVDTIASHAPIIVFRRSGITMPKASDWMFWVVSQSGVKIIEKSLRSSATE